jgi:hypothetical protein
VCVFVCESIHASLPCESIHASLPHSPTSSHFLPLPARIAQREEHTLQRGRGIVRRQVLSRGMQSLSLRSCVSLHTHSRTTIGPAATRADCSTLDAATSPPHRARPHPSRMRAGRVRPLGRTCRLHTRTPPCGSPTGPSHAPTRRPQERISRPTPTLSRRTRRQHIGSQTRSLGSPPHRKLVQPIPVAASAPRTHPHAEQWAPSSHAACCFAS